MVSAKEVIITPHSSSKVAENSSIPVFVYGERKEARVNYENRFEIPVQKSALHEPAINDLNNSFNELMGALSAYSNNNDLQPAQREILMRGVEIIDQHSSYVSSRHWYVYAALRTLINRYIIPTLTERRSIDHKLAEAIIEHCNVVISNTRDLYHLNGIADFFRREREFDNALLMLNLVLAIDNCNTDALNSIARVYYAQGNCELAKQTYQRVVGIDCNNVKAKEGLLDIELDRNLSRPLPGQQPFSSAKVQEAVEQLGGLRGGAFTAIPLESEEIQRAMQYCSDVNDQEARGFIEYLANAGLIRAGPAGEIPDFLAGAFHNETGNTSIVLSSFYPSYNIPKERAASILRIVSGALHRRDGEQRESDYLARVTVVYPPGILNSLLNQAAVAVTLEQARTLCQDVVPQAAAQLEHKSGPVEKDFTSLVVINARLYASFTEIAKEINFLKSTGINARKVLLIGAFKESKMSEKIGRGESDVAFGNHVKSYLYISRDASGKIVSIVRNADGTDVETGLPKVNGNGGMHNSAHGCHDFGVGDKTLSASAFAIPEYELSNKLGGQSGFEQMLKDIPEVDIFLDYVPHSTAVDATWLLDESLQTGDGYWYIYKELPEGQRKQLDGLEGDGLIKAADEILAGHPGYFLHYSTKLGKWILLVLSRDATMKPRGAFFNDLQVLLDITNHNVRLALRDAGVKIAKMGAKGVRVDCAQSVIVGLKNQPLGFINTWKDHIITNANPNGQNEVYEEVVPAVRGILARSVSSFGKALGI